MIEASIYFGIQTFVRLTIAILMFIDAAPTKEHPKVNILNSIIGMVFLFGAILAGAQGVLCLP